MSDKDVRLEGNQNDCSVMDVKMEEDEVTTKLKVEREQI